MNSDVTERFLKYVSFDTQSSEESGTHPSTDKQRALGQALYDELVEMGAGDVYFDRENCYVYAKLPATDGGARKETLALISHMDTSPETSGEGVKPRIVEYEGGDIYLGDASGLSLKPSDFPELNKYVGKHLIVTDGTTLLGADDKAGVAEIMAAAEYLLEHPEVKHGPVSICFTPDEEIGAGVVNIDLKRLGADYGYTVDGGELGELEYENFNAASAKITVHGVTVHPGSAKDKMKHAARIAMELDALLPAQQRPQYTSGYEGFFHLTQMSGSTELARLDYIIRDHDMDKFLKRKELMSSAVDFINKKYGEGTAELVLKDSYYNMRDKVFPEFAFLIDRAKAAMEAEGVTPIVQPIRGGTDGATLSFMGVPCPNLCAGGHNFHGRYEYVCVESMETIVKILINIIKG
ncbi:MAG: peptidase T [Lachnospiraceae bacterium]|nr:peptidase T [Lachnospiraceae bacterium]